MSYDLKRFVQAHHQSFVSARMEIERGHKSGHWMWYIFPQLKGLGRSETAMMYGIADVEEAKAFLADPFLGQNLRCITRVLLEQEMNDPAVIFGHTDARKLHSCMTLFSCAAPAETIFYEVLEKYYNGIPDYATLDILYGK